MTDNGVTDNYDIKRERKDLYAPKQGDFQFVDVPELGYLMVDGHGDPNTAPSYREAVEALYSLSYSVRAIAKGQLGRVHTVGPLEGLWSAEDPASFTARDKGSWDWTMMISQPDWITADIVDAARKGPGPVRFERFTEGRSVQVMHIGSYDDEAPTLARLHDQFMPANGLTFNGPHHEIYLSDPRKTQAAKLKTVLRQPVRPA